jgi:hypothetical protein
MKMTRPTSATIGSSAGHTAGCGVAVRAGPSRHAAHPAELSCICQLTIEYSAGSFSSWTRQLPRAEYCLPRRRASFSVFALRKGGGEMRAGKRAGTCAVIVAVLSGAAGGIPALPAVAGTARPAALTALDGSLSGVAAVSGTNAWAVGATYSSGGTDAKALVLHWNGRAWSQVPSPGPKGSALSGVIAVSATDAWAVGRISSDGGDKSKTFVLHWNGKSWSRQ